MDTPKKALISDNADDEFSQAGEITIVKTDSFTIARVLRETIGQEWRHVVHSNGALLLYEQIEEQSNWRIWLEFDDDELRIEIEELLETGWEILGAFTHYLHK